MDRERILLTEYQMCQQYNMASSHQYYLIVSIFMAVMTAVLGGLIYGVISSDFIGKVCQESKSIQVLTACSLVIILGLGMIAVLIALKKWLKRVNFLADINYWRMREIEIELGMWQSWRVHGIDNWGDRSQISEEDEARLKQYHPEKWWQAWRHSDRYESRSRNRSYDCIVWTLVSIWGLAILGAIIAIVSALNR